MCHRAQASASRSAAHALAVIPRPVQKPRHESVARDVDDGDRVAESFRTGSTFEPLPFAALSIRLDLAAVTIGEPLSISSDLRRRYGVL